MLICALVNYLDLIINKTIIETIQKNTTNLNGVNINELFSSFLTLILSIIKSLSYSIYSPFKNLYHLI
jgi:hypothetical protein